jgi:hypothetical protein
LRAINNKAEAIQAIGVDYNARINGKYVNVADKALETANDYAPDYGDISLGVKWQATKPWNPDADITGRAVLFYEDSHYNMIFGEENRSLMNLFTLYHETAHTLDKNKPGGDGKRPLPENIGDAYAAMLLLSRFGQQAVPFLQKVSLWRAQDFKSAASEGHFTSIALDQIIADSAHEDFSKLNAEDTLKRAGEYAAAWAPPIADLEQARQVYLQMPHERDPAEWLINNTRFSGYAPQNIAFYIAAKNALPVLFPGPQTGSDNPPNDLDFSTAQRLLQKAATTKLSALFNAAAEKAPDASQPTVADIIWPRITRPQSMHQ